jgi:hypothetical protein
MTTYLDNALLLNVTPVFVFDTPQQGKKKQFNESEKVKRKSVNRLALCLSP